MNMIKNCKIHCVSEALSPITHMKGISGNEAIINRERVLYKGILRDVPVLSGNAIRHRMIREPAALYLVRALGLKGKMSLEQANYLFNGGTLYESSTTENSKRIAELQTLFPVLRLLGGALKNQIIGGSLHVLRGLLFCEENRTVISKALPEGYKLPEESLRSAEEFVSQYQYTRGDASRRKDTPYLTEEDGDTNLMIYSGQSVVVGAMFYHGFVMQNISPVEVGALLHSLHQWEAAGGTIGGSARIGHGKLKMNIFFEQGETFFGDKLNPAECVKEYISHVDTHKEKCVDWLNDVFPVKWGRLI